MLFFDCYETEKHTITCSQEKNLHSKNYYFYCSLGLLFWSIGKPLKFKLIETEACLDLNLFELAKKNILK